MAYDDLIQADSQRLYDYKWLCRMYDIWANEMEYTHSLAHIKHSKTKDDPDTPTIDVINHIDKHIMRKRGAITIDYLSKYSEFIIGDKIQVIENNRVLTVSTITHMEVARDERQVIGHEMNKQNGLLHFNINEFLLYIPWHINFKPIIKPMPVYRIKSPMYLMKKPHAMCTKCPICQDDNKPMVDSIIGGEPKVICNDCDTIIRDIYGSAYVTESLNYDKILEGPASKIILNYSQYR